MKRVYPDNGDSGNPGMRSRLVRFIVFICLAGVLTILLVLFPAALRFVEMGAREVRYLWWLILMVVLGVWLIWGFGKSAR